METADGTDLVTETLERLVGTEVDRVLGRLTIPLVRPVAGEAQFEADFVEGWRFGIWVVVSAILIFGVSGEVLEFVLAS